jgi:hypothetical protein
LLGGGRVSARLENVADTAAARWVEDKARGASLKESPSRTYLRHCEERSDEAIHAAAGALSGWQTISRRWIASLRSQ